MSKLDLSGIFRHILVHPADWELLDSSWPIAIDSSITTVKPVLSGCPLLSGQ